MPSESPWSCGGGGGSKGGGGCALDDNHHSASARNSYIWTSPSAPWIASATSISPSRVARATSCTTYLPPRVASALIH